MQGDAQAAKKRGSIHTPRGPQGAPPAAPPTSLEDRPHRYTWWSSLPQATNRCLGSGLCTTKQACGTRQPEGTAPSPAICVHARSLLAHAGLPDMLACLRNWHIIRTQCPPKLG